MTRATRTAAISASPAKGTFKGSIGINIENYDQKRTIIDLLDTNLNTNVDFTTFTEIKDSLKTKFPKTLIAQQANSFLISVDTQFIGYVEGTYELGSDGSLVDMQFMNSKILTSLEGEFSTTRQHIVSPAPWYWTMEIKAGAELALELQNEYDGTAASIAPLNSGIEFGIGAKTAVGISGAASVGVKGGGNLHIEGQALPIDFSKTEVYADYNIALYGELGPFSGEAFPYESDKYYLWKDGDWAFSTDPSNGGSGGGGGGSWNVPDIGFEMQQIPRDYFDKATVSTKLPGFQLNSIAVTDSEILIKSNTYTFTEPQIVQMENGNLLLVWVDDPGVAVRPVDINRAALFYSVYDGSTWSEPAMVSDDGTADASPVLKNIDGNVYLLWNNANAVLDETAGYPEYCAALDITYARFDSASGVFTDISVIDTNEHCDILPDMALVNGVPTVVWIQNDANDPFQISGSNTLYAASLEAGDWNAAVLEEGLRTADGLAASSSGDALTVYISQDTDGNTATVEDRELFQVSESGMIQITDNDTADLKPAVIGGLLYWYQDGKLTDGTETVTLAEDTDRYVTAENSTDAAVLYQKTNEDDSVTICANILHDGAWSEEVELVTIEQYLRKFDAVMTDDGSITIITNEVEVTDNVYQQANLCSYVFGQECDIAVQQVYLNPLSMAPGGEMELFATLKNMGTAGTSNVYARIYDGENLLKEELLPVELEAGSEVTVILTYPLEETFDSESLHIEFWPESAVDGNENNNTADCEISYADVSVEELTAIQGNGTTQVSAYISNRGLTELVDVDVILYTKVGDEKKVIGSYTIPSLAVAMGEAVTFDAALEIDTVVYVEAVVADEEFNLGNNVEFTLVTAASGVLDTATHDHVFSSYVSDGNATCTEDGTMTAKCDLCDMTDTVPDVGSALGHDMSEWETVTAATCTQNGEDHRTCARCDHGEKRTLAATGHNYEAVVTAPTCTERGYTTYTCKCGESYVADYVAALGHSFGDWAVIQEPTTTEDGLEERSCTRCGHTEQRSIAKLENPFSDVVPGSFYYEPVMWAVENGITNGTSATTFSPGDPCMRAHVVTFLWRAVGSPEPTRTDDPFVDVKPGDFYYKPVLWVLENGITNGTSATTFGPSSYCNRAQVVTFLYRSLGSPALESAENPFTDVAKGSFYEKPVLWAVKNGITNGLSATSFGPSVICNRAQIVTFLYRAFVD